jgi:hypothetical protein
MAFTGVIIISSCTKLEDEPAAADMSTATIKGTALANLDLSNDTNQFGGFEIKYEKVPTGTRIIARINSADLDPTPDFTMEYQDITFETQVGNAGAYELSVYAGVGNVNVFITGEDFMYQQKINDSTYENRVFRFADQNVSVLKNISIIQDFYYVTQ